MKWAVCPCIEEDHYNTDPLMNIPEMKRRLKVTQEIVACITHVYIREGDKAMLLS